MENNAVGLYFERNLEMLVVRLIVPEFPVSDLSVAETVFETSDVRGHLPTTLFVGVLERLSFDIENLVGHLVEMIE
jgi:hypothetical protein